MYSSQQSQYHIQANAFPSQPGLNNNWIRMSYKLSRLTEDQTETETKHSKESESWLNQTCTFSRYTALLEEESEDQQHKASPESTLKPPSVYITGGKDISTLTELLEQIAEQQYKIKLSQIIRLKFSLKLLNPTEQS
jgi:hypothetical protein